MGSRTSLAPKSRFRCTEILIAHLPPCSRKGAAEQFAEKVENCSATESHSRSAMEKFPPSQALGSNSGFLILFGMTPECIFPQPVKPAPTFGPKQVPSKILKLLVAD